jgi:hypothetical protein
MSGKKSEVLDFMSVTAFDPLISYLLSTVMKAHEKRWHIVPFLKV